jgi:hypothetical protein
MSHLIIAKLIPDKFEGMSREEQAAAQKAARSLFGYEVENVKHEPTAGITFDLVHSFQRMDSRAGWMAIVNEESHVKLKSFLAENKAFASLFYSDVTPLNEDETTQQVYCRTSPISAEHCWGTRGTGGGGT